jgi:hypothetical protein
MRVFFVVFAVGFILVDPTNAANSVKVTWAGVRDFAGDAAQSVMTFVSTLVEG